MKKKQKQKQQFITKNTFTIVTVAIVSVFSILFLGLAWGFLEHLENEIEDPTQVRPLVVNSISDFNLEAPNTPQNTTQYIPEMNLQFEVAADTRIAYRFDAGEGYHPDEAYITSIAIKNSAINESYVPNTFSGFMDLVGPLQQCMRIFTIKFENDKPAHYQDGFEQVESVELDGQALHIWENNSKLCKAASTENIEDLLEVLRSAQTY